MADILTDLAKDRDRGVPIVAIDTPDQPALVAQAGKIFTGPILIWDRVRGLRADPESAAGAAYLKKIQSPPAPKKCASCGMTPPLPHRPGCPVALEPPEPIFSLASTVDLVTALDLIASEDAHKALPPGGAVFVMGAHRFMDDGAVVQACWNLRDLFKLPQHRTVLVLTGPGLRVGNDLANDVISHVEQLPDAAQAQALIATQYENAGLTPPEPTSPLMTRIVDAVIGLSAFSIEQVVALALNKASDGGIDLAQCWERKASIIESTDGLRLIYKGDETYATVVGQDAVQADFDDYMGNAALAPAVFVWIDEGEKVFAGTRGDLSGTYQDQEAVLLTRMQESQALGAIFFGLSGAGKSVGVKAIGGQFKRPVVVYDPGAMQGSLVGESQRKVRAAHRVIEAISGGKGKTFWIMTSNDLSGMKPEVKQRFIFGTYFFDSPDGGKRSTVGDGGEKDRIWTVKMAQYGIDPSQPRPDDTGWVGRNIEACCRKAQLTNRSLVYVAETIIGYGISNPDAVERMRADADGMMLSAHKRGVYRRAQAAEEKGSITVKTTGGPPQGSRQITFN